MRVDYSFLVAPAIAIVLASCSTPFRVAGIRTFGRIQDIPVADIEAAVSAYRGLKGALHERIAEIEVIGHDEGRIYQDPAPSSFISMVRVKGKWQPPAPSLGAAELGLVR